MPFKTTPSALWGSRYAATPIWTEFSIAALIKIGIHVGHTNKNSNIYNSWFLFGIRQGVALINLFKFTTMFRSSLFIIDRMIRTSSPIWFVNLDKLVKSYVEHYAWSCGEFSLTEGWVNGLLTNYKIAGFRKPRRSKIVWSRKEKFMDHNFEKWAFNRKTWPRGIFVSNVKESYKVCREADILQVNTMGIVDSDAPTLYVDIAIPGNDEGLDPIIFYNSLLATFILYKKINFITLWHTKSTTKIFKKLSNIEKYSGIFNILSKSISLNFMNQAWQDIKLNIYNETVYAHQYLELKKFLTFNHINRKFKREIQFYQMHKKFFNRNNFTKDTEFKIPKSINFTIDRIFPKQVRIVERYRENKIIADQLAAEKLNILTYEYNENE